MRATIDKAGRVVIPRALRDQVGISPGEVDIQADGASLRIVAATTDRLIERDGLLLLPDEGPEMNDEQVRRLRLDDQR